MELEGLRGFAFLWTGSGRVSGDLCSFTLAGEGPGSGLWMGRSPQEVAGPKERPSDTQTVHLALLCHWLGGMGRSPGSQPAGFLSAKRGEEHLPNLAVTGPAPAAAYSTVRANRLGNTCEQPPVPTKLLCIPAKMSGGPLVIASSDCNFHSWGGI